MTMELIYSLLDPTKNMTVLVDTPVPISRQPLCAAKLMEREKTAEQVGFLSPGKLGEYNIAMRMAGGEFCGNATMSAAALYAMRTGLTQGQVSVSVSGASLPVTVDVKKQTDGSCKGTVQMPLPRSITSARLELNGSTLLLPVVNFPGISHVILELPASGETKEAVEQSVKHWCRVLNADSLGVMLLDRAENRLTPLVYVPEANTLFWESSCASGTAAVGAYLANQTGAPIAIALKEPGGILTVEAVPGGVIRLTGTVTLTKTGTMDFSSD